MMCCANSYMDNVPAAAKANPHLALKIGNGAHNAQLHIYCSLLVIELSTQASMIRWFTKHWFAHH